jgi:hypothetical protein
LDQATAAFAAAWVMRRSRLMVGSDAVGPFGRFVGAASLGVG